MLQKIKLFFSNNEKLAQFNGILIILSLFGNWFFQVFCVPTLWAGILLIICFVNMILYPLLKGRRLMNLSAFLNGITLCIFIYCIIFLDFMNMYGIFLSLLLIGFFVFIPPFFVIQLLITNFFKQKNSMIKASFLSGIITFLAISHIFSVQYKAAFKAIEESKKTGFQSLENTFMTEKIVGMYFKYHTEVCEYDGWRPPLHEPALIIGQWFNGKQDPVGLHLPERIALYKKFFPGEPIRLNCSCAYTFSDSYYGDKLLN